MTNNNNNNNNNNNRREMNEKIKEQQHDQTQKRKMSFRQPTQIIVTPGVSTTAQKPQTTAATKQLQGQSHRINTTTEQEQDKLNTTTTTTTTTGTQREEEEEKMYFYYPKYLHPEAVALIAENLLHEWEQEEQNKSGNRIIDTIRAIKDKKQ
jgi:hypothetical protein